MLWSCFHRVRSRGVGLAFRRSWRVWASLTLAVLLAGLGLGSCQPAAPAFYYEDVRPILAHRCVGCHQDGGIAPFALTTYDLAKAYGSSLASATKQRVMPPFLADNSGVCGTFETNHWLPDTEIATLGAWVKQGMREGDPTTPPPKPTPPVVLPKLSATLDIGVDYRPDPAISDVYRCFVVEPNFATDQFLTAFEVHPGNARIVHHVIVYEPKTTTAATTARDLQATSTDGPGYACLGGARVAAQPVVLWAPGTGAQLYPSGTGIRLVAGGPLIVQVHYNTLGDPGATDRTTVDLSLEPAVTQEAYIYGVIDSNLNLPPGRAEVVEESDHASLQVPAKLYGLMPHMHTLGRTISLKRIAGLSAECLIQVPRWDFHWQLAYFYTAPKTIAPTDTLRLRCTYDTRSRTTTTTNGEGSADEMCIVFAYVTR